MKNLLNKAQIPVPIILSMGSILVGSVLWITNISADSKEADSEIRERVIKLETTIENTDKNVTEIREDLKDIKKALKVQ